MFPRAWRDRYGHEVADLLSDIESDEKKLRASDLLDLVRAGMSQRSVELWRRVAHPRRPLAARIAGGVGLVIIALVALVATSSISSPTRSSPLIHAVSGSHAPPAGHEEVDSNQQASTAQQAAAQQAAAQQAAAQATQQASTAQQAAAQATQQATARAAASAAQQTAEGAAAPVG
jgi:hypothetical protein